MHFTGKTIEDFRKSNIVKILPPKFVTLKCEEYRTLNLNIHASKIITGVIMIIIKKAMDANLNNNQFGFRQNIGTRKSN